jgi:LacI family transcriptional regulator
LERERGLRDAAQLGGALLTVLESENDAVSAKRTLAAYFDAQTGLPDVLIAGNNPLLLGSLKLMRDRGLSVPRDIALVGYDEFAWASLIDPPLTVLDERSEEIGRLAAKTLMSIINAQSEAKRQGGSSAPVYLPEHKLQVPVDLLIRLSCGCPPQLG